MQWPSSADPDGSDMAFSVATNGEPGVFDLRGDLDLDTAKVLDEVMIVADPNQTVVLDLSDLAFVDSSGLRVLIQVRRRIIDTGAHLVLRQPRPNVRRVLEVSGLDSVFTVED